MPYKRKRKRSFGRVTYRKRRRTSKKKKTPYIKPKKMGRRMTKSGMAVSQKNTYGLLKRHFGVFVANKILRATGPVNGSAGTTPIFRQWVRVKQCMGDVKVFTAWTPNPGVISQVYRANSTFDPDYATLGHQPRGRDAVECIYNRYLVLGCRITSRVWNKTKRDLMVLARNDIPSDDDQIDLDDDKPNDIIEKGLPYKVVPGVGDGVPYDVGSPVVYRTPKHGHAAYTTVSTYLNCLITNAPTSGIHPTDGEFDAPINTNPTAHMRLGIQVWNLNGEVDQTPLDAAEEVVFETKLEYDVVYFQPKAELFQSNSEI